MKNHNDYDYIWLIAAFLFIFTVAGLLFYTSSVSAETWEFAVCSKDEADLSSGHKRMKKGDIIAVKPYPWTWGVKEREIYTILVVNNLTEEEARAMCMPYYEGGILETPESIEEPWPDQVHTRLKKFDFQILKTDVLPALDLTSLEDTSTPYQPFKDTNTQLNANVPDEFNMVTDKHTASRNKKGAKKE